ncbi:response regulator [Deinococcus peraridilitoris]|uniref:CheY-like receiver domain-containing protein n=1 Tax=Deinococcus peraridilitoris (strain DSM 19664 / LMG 22246 / CIP 109416 / KR-200) TaxID=937777 RepID=L0A5T6_DEIPD|nr:response regulator [Deinococcus peraridilitoris]AFZ68532.1 CheY-like receiver domain-containing protein [Deinococcus peraridilitoris DSM 19664]
MLNILLVEDNWADAYITQESFAALGEQCRLHCVDSGEAALAFLERNDRPDVVLLDLNLPGMNGFDVLEHLRSHPTFQDTVAIALLGSSNEMAWWRDQGMRPDAFLTKPVDPVEALAVWRQAQGQANDD